VHQLTDCRARHVKCDEEQPSCSRCVKSGRVCGGYKGSFRGPPKQLRSIVPRPCFHVIVNNDAESMALDFFRCATIHQLPCASSFEMPWERMVLDMMTQHQSIAAAASACASLHRTVSDSKDTSQGQFALQQHNKSLGLMRKYINDLSPNNTDAGARGKSAFLHVRGFRRPGRKSCIASANWAEDHTRAATSGREPLVSKR
jgi:hypothetical protein